MQSVFYNGNIITMEKQQPEQAVLVENGLVQAVGSNEEILAQRKHAKHINLDGKTILPAFIDSHGHLSSYAMSLLQLSLEEAGSFFDIIDLLQQFIKEKLLQPGQWVTANDYDHNLLAEKKHPYRQLLDEYFPDRPVVLQHKSRHFGVFNTAALRQINWNRQENNGYLEEDDFVAAVKQIPMPELPQLLFAYKEAMKRYASYGITTIQEGMMVNQLLPIYQQLLAKEVLSLDVVGYPQALEAEAFFRKFPESIGQYHRHFRLGGCKIITDGSPQGRTAWMKSAYRGTTDYFGESTMSDEAVMHALQQSVQNRRQLLVHCNGDAAAEQLLRLAEKLEDKRGFAATRPVMIHAQLLAESQLDRVKQLGILPSFFIAHCYYWGDTHIRNFGLERAAKCSPAGSAEKQGILFTLHQDTPVIAPDMLETIWCAVNRMTKSGIILGAEERISVWSALKAVTINAAWQYGEEAAKGSIAPGKRADFVILDKNPLALPLEELKSSSVLATFQAGNCIYEA